MHYFCTQLRRRIKALGFFCDGDDTLVFCPASDVGYCKSTITSVASSMGLEIRVDHHAQRLDEIEFCQHRMTADCGLVPDPRRVYAKLSAAVLSSDTPENRTRAMLGKTCAVAQYLRAFPDMPLLRLLPASYNPDYVDFDIAARYDDTMRYPEWDALWPDARFCVTESVLDELVHGPER